MISIRIPRIPNLSKYLSKFYGIAFIEYSTRKMSIVWVDVRIVSEGVLDSNIVSPPTRKVWFNYFAVSYRKYWRTCRSGYIHAKVASETDIPAIIIGSSPKHGVNSTKLTITLILFIVGIHYPWKWHFAGIIESRPGFFSTTWFWYLPKRIPKIRSKCSCWNTHSEHDDQSGKEHFFHIIANLKYCTL